MTLLDPGEIPAAGARLGAATFTVLYVGGLAAPLALLQRDAAHGRAWVLLAIGVTFGNDTGAYFGGKAFGRHKLYPKVSPAKTVEGGLGGLAASLLIMFAVRATVAPWLTVVDCLAVGLPAAVLGPIGDLVESLMKRAAGVKDSGHLIPGHGGMLDRIDALLFVGAWIYVYAVYLVGRRGRSPGSLPSVVEMIAWGRARMLSSLELVAGEVSGTLPGFLEMIAWGRTSSARSSRSREVSGTLPGS